MCHQGFLPSHSASGTGGHMMGRNVGRSKRPDLDCALSTQYLFSNSMISVSSTEIKQCEKSMITVLFLLL